jgi:ATP-dependent exoDNAse (exonuclease V) beta subunit
VTWDALGRFLRHRSNATVDEAVDRLLARLRTAFTTQPGGLDALIRSGPDQAGFQLFVRDLKQLLADPPPSAAMIQALLERVGDHVLTQDGSPRKRLLYKKAEFRSSADFERHAALVASIGSYLAEALHAYRQDINFVLARAVRQLFAVALEQYRRTLQKHGVLDFSDVLERTLILLSQMEEFSRSRFKLEARYQHVLVDEFQDTSRAQWQLVELLVRSWASGLGLAERDLEPSIFIVGDRKQSIYGFRDADVAVLDEAARHIEVLRPIGQVRTAITRSFRSVRELLSFINDVFIAIEKAPERGDAFRYSEDDQFPLTSVEETEPSALGLVTATSDEQQAETVADEIAVLLASGARVRDRVTGVRRAVRAGDIAVLFRTRDGHVLFESALARRRVPYYVYKGLGFFDAPEIKDVLALLTFVARPESELNAAAFLRSRIVRLSDEALKHLAPHLAGALLDPQEPPSIDRLHHHDRKRLMLARTTVASWLPLVDRVTPSELLDLMLTDSAYAAEIAGQTHRQSRENLKKVRALVRRIQNRGYTTLGRVVDHFAEVVSGGDESNAILDATDTVNLMTTHAAKGLEFPIVFVVNLQRGSGSGIDPIRVVPAPLGRDDTDHPSVAIGERESDSDRDFEAREAEESKRLLYVALTRARDRLYLAATANVEGKFAPGKGGLGRTLPAGLVDVIAAAGDASRHTIDWDGPVSRHEFRIVRRALALPQITTTAGGPPAPIDAFAPLSSASPLRHSVTALVAERTDLVDSADDGDQPRDAEVSALVGTLIHRALADGWLGHTSEDSAGITRLLRPHERGIHHDLSTTIEAALRALSSLRRNPEVRAIFDDAAGSVVWRRHEVPFSMRRADGVIVRGQIDCLAGRPDGSVEVVEIKSGRRSRAHNRQLDMYVAAARALLPMSRIEGRIIYGE